MKVAALISGGKDSIYAAWLATLSGNELVCLISIKSENKDSYMFHTPSITKVNKQAEMMNIPLVVGKTKGKKEEELDDLKNIIWKAKTKFGFEGIVSGAIASVYQSSRIQKICNRFKLECFNPLWQRDEVEYLRELVKNKFKVIISSVAAYPLNEKWLGKEIDSKFIEEMIKLKEKYKIHPAGEGGEFESFVLDCPLFSRELSIKDRKIVGNGNSWRMEVGVE